ncbi:MAG TPA: hypothetical protein GXZ47_10635 [Treponema sp.]|nr:hypothetical protein [Treponema sp.]
MKKNVIIALLLSVIVLSACTLPPDSIPEKDMVVYRIVVKSIEFSDNMFTVDYVFNSYDGSYVADWFTADYEGSESFHIVDWILSPDSTVITPGNRPVSFTVNEGEAIPDTVILNTTKPIYLRQRVIYDEGMFGDCKADVTVAKAYFETAEISVTMKD